MHHNDLHVLQIYCEIDDFCKEISQIFKDKLVGNGKQQRNKASRLSLSEVMTIMVLFHTSGYRDFKHFYLYQIGIVMRQAFPRLVSYNRMVELMRLGLIPLALFIKIKRKGECTGINFLDSTHLSVCGNQRIHQNKVFRGLAERGKTTMGWFYGFKLHIIINEKGELLSFAVSAGNCDDRDIDLVTQLTKELIGRIYADKGYISQKLFETLFDDGKMLITKLRKNMKGKMMSLFDKIMLRKRAIIESVNDELKNICQIEHTRHRSPINWLVNVISGLVAYTYLPKKPSLKLDLFQGDNNCYLLA